MDTGAGFLQKTIFKLHVEESFRCLWRRTPWAKWPILSDPVFLSQKTFFVLLASAAVFVRSGEEGLGIMRETHGEMADLTRNAASTRALHAFPRPADGPQAIKFGYRCRFFAKNDF